MSPQRNDFTEHVAELLASLKGVSMKRMFGGQGIYCDGLMFALITGKVLYFKTDEQSRPRFVEAGCEPFRYDNKRRGRVETSYWSAPDEAMESPAAALPWARLGLQAALRRQAAASPGRRPSARRTRSGA